MAIYYVGSGGSNANPGTAVGAPWASIAYAMGPSSPVVGGDTVYVRSNMLYASQIIVGRPGAAGNPITLETYPVDMPVQARINYAGFAGIYNAISSSWTIKNLEIDSSVGGAGIYFDDAPGLAANMGWTIDGCHIHHNVSGDNASGIFIQRQRGTFLIQNCRLHDNLINPPNATSGYNATGVVIFGYINPGSPGAFTCRFLHNEVWNQAVGFKNKHLHASDTVLTLEVAYNFFHEMTGRACVELAATDATHTNVGNSKRVHHNLLINSPNGTALKSAADFGDWDTEWDHNTVYNCESGWTAHREDASNESHRNTVHDNVWCPRPLAAPPVGYGVVLETTVAPLNTFDYNSFWDVTPTTTVATISGVGNQNMAGWQASTNLPDAHGARIDPLFVAIGTGGATGDFHLQPGSTLRNSGSNGKDKGCYELRTEVMGPIASVTPPDPEPVAPSLTLTQTVLAGDCAITDDVIRVASVAGFAVDQQILVDREVMIQLGAPLGLIVPVGRGLDGTVQAAHSARAIVTTGRPQAFPPPAPGQTSTYGPSAPDGR